MRISMAVAAVVAFMFIEHALFELRNGGRNLGEWTSASAPASVASTIRKALDLLLDQSVMVAHMLPDIALGITGDEQEVLWYFYGTHGVLPAALPRPAIVKTVRLKHHPERRACMARDIVVWGLIPDSPSVELYKTSFSSSALPEELRTSPPLRFWISLAHIDAWEHWTPGHTDLAIPPLPVDDPIYLYAIAVELKGNGGYEKTCFPGFSAFGVTQG